MSWVRVRWVIKSKSKCHMAILKGALSVSDQHIFANKANQANL